MQNEYQTKDMAKSQKKTKVAAPSIKNKYFFAGEGVYKPLTVEAENMSEALELYEKQKEAINN